MPRSLDVSVGTSIIIVRNGHVLLGLRKGAHHAGCWALPGGWVDREDTSTEIAVAREVKQETDLVLDVSKVERIGWTTEDQPELECRTITLWHSYTSEFGGEVKLAEPDKCEEWRWFDLSGEGEPIPYDNLMPGTGAILREFSASYSAPNPH